MTAKEIEAGRKRLAKFTCGGIDYPNGVDALKPVAEKLRKRIPASFWTLDSPSVGESVSDPWSASFWIDGCPDIYTEGATAEEALFAACLEALVYIEKEKL
jgi:hypothetical protein